MDGKCLICEALSLSELVKPKKRGPLKGPFFPVSNLLLIRHCLQLVGDGAEEIHFHHEISVPRIIEYHELAVF